MFFTFNDIINNSKEQEEFAADIQRAHMLTVNMQSEAEKYQKLSELAFNDEIATIKKNLSTRWSNLTYAIGSANSWIHMLLENEKIDRRKKYEEEENYNYLTQKLNELFDADIYIENITFYGFDHAAYNIIFSVKNDLFSHKFELMIPNIDKLNKENIYYCDYGKLRLSFMSNSSCCDYICSSYFPDDLKKALKDFQTPKPV